MSGRSVGAAGAMMDVTVEIHCAKCGSGNYSLPQGVGGDAPLLCMDCGIRLGSVAELQAEMLEQALARCAETLRRGLAARAAGEAA